MGGIYIGVGGVGGEGVFKGILKKSIYIFKIKNPPSPTSPTPP